MLCDSESTFSVIQKVVFHCNCSLNLIYAFSHKFHSIHNVFFQQFLSNFCFTTYYAIESFYFSKFECFHIPGHWLQTGVSVNSCTSMDESMWIWSFSSRTFRLDWPRMSLIRPYKHIHPLLKVKLAPVQTPPSLPHRPYISPSPQTT